MPQWGMMSHDCSSGWSMLTVDNIDPVDPTARGRCPCHPDNTDSRDLFPHYSDDDSSTHSCEQQPESSTYVGSEASA